MNPQETEHVIACDEAWVPAAKRVKISPTNVRLETTVQQKEETFQDVKDSESYEFMLANKICVVDAKVFRKTASNDKLRKSRIDILWGMFYRENVDYPALIWEDIAYQIDHRKKKKSRRENMPYPRLTKVIIDYFLSKHKSLKKLKFQHYHTIKDDDLILSKVSLILYWFNSSQEE
nr:hypothetical protein [Tanacetum cinerariifolium]